MLPFSSLVRHEGNEPLFSALEMSALSTLGGVPLHLHVEGLRGTGKTTIMRAVSGVLPRIVRVRGCVYNCDPAAPHCPAHATMPREELDRAGAEEIAMPFLEISHSAKMGTVVGSIDLARITDRQHPEAALLAGTIPQANRGIVFVDEINRLAEVAPELADVLLSVMGTKPGKIQIEETGLPIVQMPIWASVWATSNPDEDPGPLEDVRRQLSDRFDFLIHMSRPTSVAQVISILRRSGQEKTHTYDFPDRMAAALARNPVAGPAIEEMIARLYLDFGLESLRAVESLLHGARMRAGILGHGEVTVSDVLEVAPMALRHRVEMGVLNQILSYIQGLGERQAAGQSPSDEPPSDKVAPRPVQPVPSHDGRVVQDPFSRLFCRVKDALVGNPAAARQGNGPQSPGLDPFGRSPSSPAAPQGQSQRAPGPGRGSIADPMKVALTAPELEAVPMMMLAMHDLVRSPEQLER
jgi:magnesium chelatase subunit I